MKSIFCPCMLLLASSIAWSQIPSGYYDSALGLNGQALANALHQIIDDHTRIPYTSSATDTWDVIAIADEDPGNPSNILTIYKNESKAKSDHSQATGWNREHSWPKSYGFKVDNSCNYPYTDLHHLYAADWDYNSSRSNLPYDNCTGGCTTLSVDDYPFDANLRKGTGNTGSFQAWDLVKGDLARAMFYMAIRYDGGTHGLTGCSEPDLMLTDDRNLIISSTTNQSQGYMGLLSVLLQWHEDDPVDAFEEFRHEVIFGYQGNRNPFIDHPEYVASIFGTSSIPGGEDELVWINEIHYDNSGSDSNEGVEIAGTAGTDLSGWQLVAYNGNGGSVYQTQNLNGSLADQQNGFGTKWYAMPGLQNGAPDGIALIDSEGAVVQFLSYEGVVNATSGPANGMSSVNIGVSETSSTPFGFALQLEGTGSSYEDFTWSGPIAHSRDQVNANQIFVGAPQPASDPWINEIHYDNSGSDSNEGVEISGPAGTDLSQWQIVAYNGSNQQSYKTTNLNGVIPNSQNGFGQIWFPISGLQNGAPDGLALVDPNGLVIQFLSYEGSFTASNGPASGLTSEDIGVSESSATASGRSLQLSGTGSQYNDFTWNPPNSHSRDQKNSGQTYQ